jgi:hypothetical protein
MGMSDSTACRHMQLSMAELALGVLVGTERAEALQHLDTCADCRAEVERFSAATDAVLQLAPVADPPAGFEVRLLARRAADQAADAAQVSPSPVVPLARRPRPVRSPWVRGLVGIAAAILLAAGVGIGILVAPSGTIRNAPMRAATLSYDGAARGEVAVAPGHPSFLFMSIEMPRWSGWVRCVVVERGGRHVTVGRVWLDHGRGAWEAPLNMSGASVAGALVVAQDGHVMASASFPE